MKQVLSKFKNVAAAWLPLSAFAAFAGLLAMTLVRAHLRETPYILGEWNRVYYLLWALLALMILSALKDRRLASAAFGLLVVMAVCIIFGEMNLSRVDECCHLDYICYVAKMHRLPKMTQLINTQRIMRTGAIGGLTAGRRYEAVQVPLYYLLMSVPAMLIRNMRALLYFCRLAGLGMWCGAICLYRKILLKLHSEGLLKDYPTAFCLLCLFGMNPGVLIRCIFVSNEPLTILLTAGALYVTVQILLYGYSLRRAAAGTLLCICLFYTKSTGVFVIGGLWLVLLYRRRLGICILSAAAYAASAVPWFLRSLRLYGSFTGMNEHINLVINNINPMQLPINPYTEIFCIFIKKYFIPADVEFPGTFAVYINIAVSVLVICLLAVCILRELLRLFRYLAGKWRFCYSTEEKRDYLLMISAALAMANISMLAISSVSTLLDTLIGRYLYFLILPLSVLFTDLTERYRQRIFCAGITAVVLSVLFLDTFTWYAASIGGQHGWFEPEYEHVLYEQMETNAGRVQKIVMKQMTEEWISAFDAGAGEEADTNNG